MIRTLSKSRFKKALECPSKLYYLDPARKKEYPSTMDGNEFMEALAEGGFQVGTLAQKYYPDGILVETLDYQTSLDETNKLLEKENVVIFEAAVAFNDFFVRVDILEKEGNSINLIEVKAKSWDSTDPTFFNKSGYIDSKWLPYLEDVAFQTHVLQDAFPDYTINPFLMLADKGERATVEGLNQMFMLDKIEGERISVKYKGPENKEGLGSEILIRRPVGVEVDMIFNGTAVNPKKRDQETRKLFIDRANEYANYYKEDKKYPVSIGAKCKSCEYRFDSSKLESGQKVAFRECWKEQLGWTDADFSKPHLFDIWNFMRTAAEMADGNYLMEQLTEYTFMQEKKGQWQWRGKGDNAQRQWLQVEKTLDNDQEEHVDHMLFAEMNSWVYPLHFIDFETSMVAVPFNKGRHPYEQIAFQFSCHTVYEDGRIEHDEWIERKPGQFPNFRFVAELKSVLENDNGTIFRFAAHENTVLRQIRDQLIDAKASADSSLPDNYLELIAFINLITHPREDEVESDFDPHSSEREMVDLLEMVRKYYYHIYMGGSNSIKSVLPTVMRVSPFLKEKYSKPIPSTNSGAMTWWQEDKETGEPLSPYKLLPPMVEELKTMDGEIILPSGFQVSDGGAALTAYGKLQFTDLNTKQRNALIDNLLKYCELDTLAMVMIWEHWQYLATKMIKN